MELQHQCHPRIVTPSFKVTLKVKYTRLDSNKNFTTWCFPFDLKSQEKYGITIRVSHSRQGWHSEGKKGSSTRGFESHRSRVPLLFLPKAVQQQPQQLYSHLSPSFSPSEAPLKVKVAKSCSFISPPLQHHSFELDFIKKPDTRGDAPGGHQSSRENPVLPYKSWWMSPDAAGDFK